MSDGWKTKRLENLEVNPAVPKTSMSLVSVELNFGSQQKQAGFLRLATNRSWTLAGLVLLVDLLLNWPAMFVQLLSLVLRVLECQLSCFRVALSVV